MTGDGYLEYPHRRRGYDQDRYDWEILFQRPAPAWPGGKTLAAFVVLPLQWFRWNHDGKPIRPLGAPSKEHPDYREWSWKDYGHRVGLFRVLDLLDRYGLRATAAIDAETCRHYPRVVEELRRRGIELACHGLSASDVHHEGLDEDVERARIAEALEVVGAAAGRPVRGWLSPALSESLRTPDMLAEAGIDYLCDWGNDDLPYPFRAGGRELVSLPVPMELHDVNLIWQLHHTAPEWAEQLVDAIDLLHEEARTRGARTLSFTLTPWLVGQPHRIPHVERVLASLAARPGLWSATGSEIVDAWRAPTT